MINAKMLLCPRSKRQTSMVERTDPTVSVEPLHNPIFWGLRFSHIATSKEVAKTIFIPKNVNPALLRSARTEYSFGTVKDILRTSRFKRCPTPTSDDFTPKNSKFRTLLPLGNRTSIWDTNVSSSCYLEAKIDISLCFLDFAQPATFEERRGYHYMCLSDTEATTETGLTLWDILSVARHSRGLRLSLPLSATQDNLRSRKRLERAELSQYKSFVSCSKSVLTVCLCEGLPE